MKTFDANSGVYMGTVLAASVPGPVLQGVIAYTLSVETAAGPLTIAPVHSFQHQWLPVATSEVVAWPVGTPLAFAMSAGQSVGLFVEPPASEDCVPP